MDDRLYRSGYRPLAPKLGTEPPAPNRGSEDNRNKRSSTACSECKQRRIKCSVDGTGPPCTECAVHGRECIFDERQDKRRKVAREQIVEDLKRTQDDLRYARGYLEYLLDAIRYSNRDDVDELVTAIRGGALEEHIPHLISQITHFPPKFDFSQPADGYSRYGRMPDGGQHDTPEGLPDGSSRSRRYHTSFLNIATLHAETNNPQKSTNTFANQYADSVVQKHAYHIPGHLLRRLPWCCSLNLKAAPVASG